MSEYVPMQGPLPGVLYTPSNGTEGAAFFDDWCSNCARDKAMREGLHEDECDDNEKCEIIAASFRGEHVEWRELEDGTVKCMAFVQAGEQVPPPRCEHTVDMFDNEVITDPAEIARVFAADADAEEAARL